MSCQCLFDGNNINLTLVQLYSKQSTKCYGVPDQVMLKSGRQGSFTMLTSQTRKLEATGLTCSSADTVSELNSQPALFNSHNKPPPSIKNTPQLFKHKPPSIIENICRFT